MEINIAVVDDRRHDTEKLQRAIHKWFSENHYHDHTLKNITCFSNGEAVLRDFMPGKFNIVFMDIIMDGMNGIETSKKLRELDPQLIIIFITTSSEYAFETFPVHPFDYIMKPFQCERIYQVLSEAIRVIDAPDPIITVRVSRSVYKIRQRSISAVIANDHTVEIVMSNGNSHLCSMAFREFEDMLRDCANFLERNRGVIINMDNVSSLSRDKSAVIMSDGTHYALKVKSRGEIIRAFTQYQISRMRRGGKFC